MIIPYGMAFVPANMLFLALGVLLTMAVGTGMKGDEMLPSYIQGIAASQLLPITSYLFIIGIVAASFSSADSALTSLTTCFCVDIRHQPDNEPLRKKSQSLFALHEEVDIAALGYQFLGQSFLFFAWKLCTP